MAGAGEGQWSWLPVDNAGLVLMSLGLGASLPPNPIRSTFQRDAETTASLSSGNNYVAPRIGTSYLPGTLSQTHQPFTEAF